MTVPARQWQQAVDALEGARQVALACHHGPDGDALGSMLGLGLALRRIGIHSVASFDDEPFEVPRRYAFLPGQDLLVPPARFPEAPPLLVTFDCGSADRLGSLEPSARAAGRIVAVDHHASGEPFGDVRLVDPAAAASAQLVFELIRRLGIALDAEVATCLYTGLVTDTGSFKYRNTTPEIHRLAAELLSHGIRHDEVVRAVFDTNPVGYLKLAAVALGRAEVSANVIWTWVDAADLAEAGVSWADTEPLIDLVRTADATDVACVLKQLVDGRYKVSLRSKGGTDVGVLCESLGGGGHALAAGYVSAATDPRAAIAEVTARVVAHALPPEPAARPGAAGSGAAAAQG